MKLKVQKNITMYFFSFKLIEFRKLKINKIQPVPVIRLGLKTNSCEHLKAFTSIILVCAPESNS